MNRCWRLGWSGRRNFVRFFAVFVFLGIVVVPSVRASEGIELPRLSSEKAAGAAIRQGTDLHFDLVINGGTFSAPSAALQAARTNPEAHILLLEPTDWLGGQATSQGVSAIDNPSHNPGASLMRNNPSLYYPADYLDFLDRMRTPPPEAPGEGLPPPGTSWVSREAFDPRTGAWVLDQMVAEYPNVTLMKMTVVKALETVSVTDEFGLGRHITELTIIEREPFGDYQPFDKFLSEEIHDWYDPNDSADYAKHVYHVLPRDSVKGLVLVDASELADLIVLSGAVYTVGRELTTEKIAEDGTLPAMDEGGTQAFVYPFCMTDATAAHDESEIKASFVDFDAYAAEQNANYFSLGSFSWERVWTYRRLKTDGPLYQFDVVTQGDVSMQNWYPGNDYPYGSMYLDRAGAAAETTDWRGGVALSHLATAEKHAVAWYFYMKDHRVTAWDTHYLWGDDPLNMMGTATGLAKFPYIRGTRRIIGLDHFRITERHFVDTSAADYTTGTSFRFYDSVGIGNYAADVHPSYDSTGISPSRHRPAPFYIPYRCLGSTNVRNLLVGGKTIATTFISNSAYRLHPIEWAIGSGAGAAAAFMVQGASSNHDLLEIPTLRALQNAVGSNSPISWAAFDAEPIVDRNGDLIVNNLDPIVEGVPFQVEVYHHRAYRVRIYLEGEFLGETTTRANGRLVLDVATAPTGSSEFTVECYDAGGNLIDVINPYTIDDNPIVDNEDPRFSVNGSWIWASAQPDKYGISYHYTSGGGGANKATWELYIPVSGLYEVSTWYPAHSNRASDSPFTVHHAGGATTVRINQQTNGGQWIPLGQFFFDSDGDNRVVLTDDVADSESLVVADAVRVTSLISSVPQWSLY